MAIVQPAPHFRSRVPGRPIVVVTLSDGSQRAFVGVTRVTGGFYGGTLTFGHDEGSDTFKVADAPNRWVPRNSVSLKAPAITDVMVIGKDGVVKESNVIHGALVYVYTGE